MILNIRGPNGAGKTTLARYFIREPHKVVDLVEFFTNSKRPMRRTVPGYVDASWGTCVVGSYANACGGMDGIKDFATARAAIRAAAEKAPHVIAEGVLASTVFGSWADFAKQCGVAEGGPFAFAYLRVPLNECLARIQLRNGGKPIKSNLVAHKIAAIEGTRKKAIAAGFHVYDLPLGREEMGPAALAILNGTGEGYRAVR